MPNISPESIDRLSALQNQIWQTVSLTVSEASNQQITFGSPLTVSAPTSDLYADIGSAMLVIQFAFAHMPEHSQVLLMPTDSLLNFSSELKGQQVTEVDENLLADIRPSIEAIVQGICMAVGNIRNEAMAASGLSIRYQIVQFPPNSQRQDELIRTQVAVTSEELSASLVRLVDEESAQGISFVRVAGSAEDGDVSAPNYAQVNASTGSGGASGPAQPFEDAGPLEMLLDIPLEISVELGRVRMMVKDVVDLGTGSIVEIDKAAGEPVDVMVNGRLVAKGEVVVIEDNFGVRITEILTPQERLAKLNEVA